MDFLKSMKDQLSQTGLYRLDGTTEVDFELAAYAEGLSAVCGELQTLQAESFLPTASGYGLEERERACGLPPAGDAAARREALRKLEAVRPGTCTREGLESVFSAFGLSVSLTEDAANLRIIAHFQAAPSCGKTRAQKILEIFCPAHLAVESDYSGVS